MHGIKAMDDTQQMSAGAQEARVLQVLEKLNQSHAMGTTVSFR
jgi:hypothetical protein